MNTENHSEMSQTQMKKEIRIIGVGNAGAAMIAAMDRTVFSGTTFHVVNTEAVAMMSPDVEVLHLENRLLRGMGTGGDPERGKKIAEEHFGQLKELCGGAGVVFILAGLGGGAGTGILPVLARAAKESGALTVGFATTPFELEGNRRSSLARHGLELLRANADAVVCLANQRAYKMLDEQAGLIATFDKTGRMLVEAMRGVWRLLRHRGPVEIHFEQLAGLLRERHGESWFASVEAAGTTRAHDITGKLSAHPLLEGEYALKNASTILVSIMGGSDMTMAHVNHVMHHIQQDAPKAKVIMGAAADDSFREHLAVTVFALRAGKGGENLQAAESIPEFDTELIQKKEQARPASRVVVPAPAASLNLDQRETLVAKSGLKGPRARKSVSKMKQGTLALDIVNRGRFDKTEATIRNGEDLDLPTFMRRGVTLN